MCRYCRLILLQGCGSLPSSRTAKTSQCMVTTAMKKKGEIYHPVINQTDLNGGEHEHGSRGKQQQAPNMLQLLGHAKSGNTIQQGRQQCKEQASNTPLQPPLYAPVVQLSTPCVWQAPLLRGLHHSWWTVLTSKAKCNVSVHLCGWSY